MSYTVTKFPQGTFSWADVMSTDIKKTEDFLTGLFDWALKHEPTPMDVDYTMFYLDNHTVAGGTPIVPEIMPHMKDVPSHWMCYITVDNVDEMAKKTEKLGGKVLMPPMDVMESGRTVTITDPTGAAISLWQPKNHIGAGIVNTVGAMGWNELYTRDSDKAKQFFSKLFGWTYDVSPELNNYITIKNHNGRMNGGIMEIQPEWGDMPPAWVPYFTVTNVDESIALSKKLGGDLVGEANKAPGVGSFAMIHDPAGAHFMIIQMESEPNHWEE